MRTKVQIEKHGRSATITYTDAKGQAHAFEAELGGKDVLLCIYAPAPAEWAARTPWRAEERSAVLEDMARKVGRKEGLGQDVRLVGTGIDIYRPTSWWRRWWG